MTQSIATLGIAVTSQGVKEASAQLDNLSKSGAKAEAQTAKVAPAFDKAAVSAKQLQQATRQLPAQFSDIVVSLQAGQSPLNVLFQQGAQIRDAFGSTRGALAGVAGQITGLINPVTVLAAAAAALAIAWKQGSNEATAYNRALILTGNSAGTTAANLAEAARQIDLVAGTQAAAAEALATVASTGRFTEQQIISVATAAEQLRLATGQAIGDTVDEFTKLARDPVDAIVKLNEQQNFLTADIYEQIKALQAQGREQEAAALAIGTYAGEIEKRSAQIRNNLGLLERSWMSIKGAAAEAWDAMLGIGRTETPGQRIAEVQRRIREIENPSNSFSFAQLGPQGSAARQKAVATYRRELAKLQGQLAAEDAKASRQGAASRAASAAISLDQEAASYASAEQKRANRIAKVRGRANQAVQDAIAAGSKDLIAKIREDEKRIVDAIVEEGKRAERKPRKPRKAREQADDGLGILARIRQQIALNGEELASQDKLSASDRLRISIQEQLKDARNNVTAASRAAITSALEELDASAKAVEQQKEELRLKEDLTRLTNELTAAENNRRQQNENDLLAIGAGREQVEQARRRLDIEREYQNGLRALRDRGVAADSESYRQQEALLRESRDRSLQDEAAFQSKRVALLADWRNGANAAIEDFITEAGDIAGQTYDLFAGAFDGLTNVITDFVTKGKADFKGFLDGLAADITAFIIKQQLSKFLQSLATSTGGGEGNFFGQIAGAILGGGRAIGGPVSGGRLYAVAEKGQPEILDVGNSRYLIPPKNGKVTPMTESASGGASFVQNLSVTIAGRPDRRTPEQFARASGREAKRGLARTGG